MKISLYKCVNDPELFTENQEGKYEYYSYDSANGVCGHLTLVDDPVRDIKAQLEAGGELRRDSEHEWGADDGGHLIGARFGGKSTKENLIAQNRNFNRAEYKRIENHWAEKLKSGNKVFVNLEYENSERPEAIQGFAIIESPDGRRDVEFYSLYNESRMERAAWEADSEKAMEKIERDVIECSDELCSEENQYKESGMDTTDYGAANTEENWQDNTFSY